MRGSLVIRAIDRGPVGETAMTADPEEGQPTTTDHGTGDGEGLIAGRYRLLAELGGGAMGVVWRARDEVLGRDVAVKQLRPDTGMSGAQVRQSHLRARREGRIAARLQHPNAVTIFDVAEHDGRPYLIMEYVPSSNLADILATGTVMTPAEVARIGAQLSSALAAAHAVGIVHRDIKPGNVLMTADGTVKLTDFGISRATGDATVTATGEILGTPAYTAPEVAQGHAVDSPADVFSLGATLYAAVEGTPPFGDDVNAMAVLLRVVRNELRPPRRAGMLTDTVLRMLSPEPADRPTMKEVSQALAALGTTPLPAVEAATVVDPGVRPVPGAADVTEALALEAIPVPLPRPTPTPDIEAGADSEAESTAGDAAESGSQHVTPASLPEATPEESRPKPTAALPAALPTTALPAVSPTTAMTAAAGDSVSDTGPLGTGSQGTGSLPEPAATGSPASRKTLIYAGGGIGVAAVVVAAVVALSGGGGDHPPAAQAAQTSTASHSPSPTAQPTPKPPASTSTSGAAAPPASSPSSAASSQTSATSSSPTSSPTSSATTSPTGDVPTQLAAAITNYYSLVPGNLDQAWNDLTPEYQQNKALGFANYKSFWTGMQRVTVSDVQAQAPDKVTATIDYFPKSGQATEERTSFTLVQDGGVWKIAHSSVISSRNI